MPHFSANQKGIMQKSDAKAPPTQETGSKGVLRRFGQIALGHRLTLISAGMGFLTYAFLPPHDGRSILGWDSGAVVFLMLAGWTFTAPTTRMPMNARAQEEGEWTIFSLVLSGVIASFAVILNEFASSRHWAPSARTLHVGLVVLTLFLSWLVTQASFALRYAHEYYTSSDGSGRVDGGLSFPGEDAPDYWDFLYFSLVLGMTFQVSDVAITSRKLRRLAAVQGFLGFLFNTVIVALTVNLAAGLV
jgi:uncharacterized membrane protein